MRQTVDFFRGIKAGPGGVLAAGLVLSAVLAGCVASGDGPAPAARVVASAPAPVGLSREVFVGRWGMASFHVEKDRKRTEAQAKAQCSQPYTIAKGPSDGVMMHVADDPKLYELRLKAGPDGRNYLGFESPAGDPQDREILSVGDDRLVMRFVDADAHGRYGTFIFARCA